MTYLSSLPFIPNLPHRSEKEICFCLSNGISWIFAILKTDANNARICYLSVARQLDKFVIEQHSEEHVESISMVQDICELVLEWVSRV